MKRIGLKEAIGILRTELSESILAAVNEDLRFEVGEITLEFKVEVERAVGGSGKINVYVVELGAEGSQTSTTTHTVRIPLKPVRNDGQPVLTGGNASIIPE